ncbi:hypothetical protein QUA71_06430 [Microcoleus sp. MON1_C5]
MIIASNVIASVVPVKLTDVRASLTDMAPIIETLSEELAEMGDRYLGHPKALQLITALIRDDTEFQGNVGLFLHQRDWLLIRDIERAIDEMIARLSDGEQTCLSRISVYQTSEYPLSFAGISAQMPEVSKYELK